MTEKTQKQNIIIQWVSWQFFEMPRNILKGCGNFLKFGLYYFSTPLLLKTFFSPWRKYVWYYPKGFDIGKYFETFFSNLISRVLGALVRSLFIIAGVLAEIFIFFAGIIIFLTWLILPVFLIAGFVFGLRIIL